MSDEVEALIHPSDDGTFWAEVVGLHGCLTQGGNYSKIMARLRDAHEICSAAPASPAPPAGGDEIEPAAGATIAELVGLLEAVGWSALDGAGSELHRLMQHGESGARLTIPVDDGEGLGSGYLEAVKRFLRGGE